MRPTSASASASKSFTTNSSSPITPTSTESSTIGIPLLKTTSLPNSSASAPTQHTSSCLLDSLRTTGPTYSTPTNRSSPTVTTISRRHAALKSLHFFKANCTPTSATSVLANVPTVMVKPYPTPKPFSTKTLATPIVSAASKCAVTRPMTAPSAPPDPKPTPLSNAGTSQSRLKSSSQKDIVNARTPRTVPLSCSSSRRPFSKTSCDYMATASSKNYTTTLIKLKLASFIGSLSTSGFLTPLPFSMDTLYRTFKTF